MIQSGSLIEKKEKFAREHRNWDIKIPDTPQNHPPFLNSLSHNTNALLPSSRATQRSENEEKEETDSPTRV